MKCAVVIFRSTHLAVRAEQVTKSAGIRSKLIPAPRNLSFDCGVAMRIPADSRDQVESILVEHELEYESIADLDW